MTLCEALLRDCAQQACGTLQVGALVWTWYEPGMNLVWTWYHPDPGSPWESFSL